MNGQRHHLPGRLRLRFTQLKQDTGRLAMVAAAMRDVDGVQSVEASPFCGGMLINYDAAMGASRTFWNDIEEVLLAHQLQHNPRPLGRQEGMRDPDGTGMGRTPAHGADGAVVDKVIERCALAPAAAWL